MRKRACTVEYDPGTGEVLVVRWAKPFLRENELLRADVLADVLEEVLGAYRMAVLRWVRTTRPRTGRRGGGT